MIDESRVIENIKKLRELKNITRLQMAADLNMSLSGYSKLERGEVELTIKKLNGISEALKVSVMNILNFNVSGIIDEQRMKYTDQVDLGYLMSQNEECRERYIQMLQGEIERLKI